MEIQTKLLDPKETTAFALRALYHSFGYRFFKMSKFESYDLYVQNRSFLVGENILTFTDLSGRLMALKPDVTLSIIKNYTGGQQKVYYHENVYREGSGAHEFSEIMQAGLECIGQIDLYTQYEVLTLAAKSLECISRDTILDVASVGLLRGLLAATQTDEQTRQSLLGYVRGKNAHNILSLCREKELPEPVSRLWQQAATLYGPAVECLEALRPQCVNEEMAAACDELSALCRIARDGGLRLNLDCSIVSDLDYYNGLVFKGYVQGLHTRILSGGRYDGLVQKMGKNAGAIGFAVYLDLLGQLTDQSIGSDTDVLLRYGAEADVAEVMAKAQALRAKGLTVRVQQSDYDGPAAETIHLEGGADRD